MAPKTVLFVVMLLIGTFTVKGEAENESCLYQYVQQPKTSLSCNPYGSSLQLHCGVTGPLYPKFHLEWYSRTSSNTTDSITRKLSSYSLYRIQSNVADSMGETRTVSSVLLIKEIDSTHDQTCVWCQIEFSGLILSETSSSLCIENEEYYTGSLQADSCSDGTMSVDTSISCVNISDKMGEQLELLENGDLIQTSSSKPTVDISSTAQLTPTPRMSGSVHPTSTNHVGSSGLVVPDSEAIVPLKTSINIDLYSLHTATPVAMSTSKTHASATPSSTLHAAPVSSSVTQSTVRVTMSATTNESPTTGVTVVETVPKSSFEGALYAAIIVCILFVGVILILVVVIVCLMRKKCSCLEQTGQSLRQRVTSSQGGRNQPGNHVTSGSDVHEQIDGSITTAEVGLHSSTQVEVSNSLGRSRSFNADDSIKPSRPLPTYNRDFHRAASNEPPPPKLPPKPPKKSATLPPKGYDHLEPVTLSVDNHSHSSYPDSSYVESSGSAQIDSSLKPAMPVMGNPSHYYHTLENSNDESGLLRSATASHTSSQAGNLDGTQNNEVTSSRLKELFDDPRYALLVLESDQTVSGLTKRKDFSRSSPSIITLIQPQNMAMNPNMVRGAEERRSLRLPKWISTTKTRGIYDN